MLVQYTGDACFQMGVYAKLAVIGVQMAYHDGKRKILRRKHGLAKLSHRRLHISGEYYVH